MQHIYNDGTYLKNNPTWGEEDAPVKAKNILKIIERNSLSYTTVGEVGCGSGEVLFQLEKALPNVQSFYGFDISSAAINIAKKKETEKIKFKVHDFANKGEDNFSFDLLLVIDVLEHVQNYFSLLDWIVPKSKYTIFHIPLDLCVWTLFKEKILIDSKKRVGHIHNFTEDFIKHILSSHGFLIIDQIYTKPTFETLTFKERGKNILRKIAFMINKRFATKTFGGYSIMLLTRNPV